MKQACVSSECVTRWDVTVRCSLLNEVRDVYIFLGQRLLQVVGIFDAPLLWRLRKAAACKIIEQSALAEEFPDSGCTDKWESWACPRGTTRNVSDRWIYEHECQSRLGDGTPAVDRCKTGVGGASGTEFIGAFPEGLYVHDPCIISRRSPLLDPLGPTILPGCTQVSGRRVQHASRRSAGHRLVSDLRWVRSKCGG